MTLNVYGVRGLGPHSFKTDDPFAGLPELELAIDSVGRDAVFARACAAGWQRGEPAPEGVWWNIVADLRAEKARLERQP